MRVNTRKSPYPFYQSNNPLFADNTIDLAVFKNKPFWIWNTKEHNKAFSKTNGKCCFNHLVSLPLKNNREFPIFDYQELIYNAIEQNQNIWILKSRGIGLTTFIIRYLAWKILSGSDLDNKSIFIISGTREEHANYIKEQLRKLFEKNFPSLQLESRYTELTLKSTWVKVFPTNNIKAIRGYFEASYIWADESDHFDPSIEAELLNVISPYEEKSNAKIILSSTPNLPEGLMQRIELDSKSKYYKLKLDYTYGLDKIYDRAFIETKKLEPEFPREYECKYGYGLGNVFTPQQVDFLQELGSRYSVDKIPVSLYTLKSVGIDPAFASSSTGIIVLEHIRDNDKDIIRVVDSHLIDKADPNQIVTLCWDIWKKHGFINTVYWIDGSNRAMVNLLKIRWQEPLTWENKDLFGDSIKIRPVNFSTEHKNMLSNLHTVATKGYLAIDPKYDKLITSLRTAYANEYSLDKKDDLR